MSLESLEGTGSDFVSVVKDEGTYYFKTIDGKKVYHRENGPAIIWSNSNLEWWLNGKIHRQDGPALIDNSGLCDWYTHGEKYVHPIDSYFSEVAECEDVCVITNFYSSDEYIHDGDHKSLYEIFCKYFIEDERSKKTPTYFSYDLCTKYIFAKYVYEYDGDHYKVKMTHNGCEFYKNDELHCEFGPAIVDKSGENSKYYLNGTEYPEEYFHTLLASDPEKALLLRDFFGNRFVEIDDYECYQKEVVIDSSDDTLYLFQCQDDYGSTLNQFFLLMFYDLLNMEIRCYKKFEYFHEDQHRTVILDTNDLSNAHLKFASNGELHNEHYPSQIIFSNGSYKVSYYHHGKLHSNGRYSAYFECKSIVKSDMHLLYGPATNELYYWHGSEVSKTLVKFMIGNDNV